MSFSVTMPALGESVTEGTVTRWLKNVGDTVEADEPLLEVSTDKVDTEIPSPASGVLTSIIVGEDETVDVGTELAVIGDPSESSGSDDAPTSAATSAEQPAAPEQPAPPAQKADSGGAAYPAAPESAQAPSAQPQQSSGAAAESAAGASSGSGAISGSGTTVKMPALGESVTEGTVTRWLKRVGDDVAVDEPLLEISTDKVDTEIPSPAAGTLVSIAVGEDETVAVGTALAVIGSARDAHDTSGMQDIPAASASQPAAQPASTEPAASGASPEPAAAAQPPAAPPQESSARAPQAQSGSVPAPQAQTGSAPAAQAPTASDAGNTAAYVTPLVRKLAAQHDVDLSSITGTGVGGRIRKQDVLEAAEAAKAASDAPQASAPQAQAQGQPAQATGEQTQAAPYAPSGSASKTSESSAALRGTTVKMTRLRQVIAKRMVESLQTSAQLTTVTEVDLTRVAALRTRAKATFAEREGVKLSFLPFFAKAAVEALKAHPVVNARIDTAKNEIEYHGAEHLGVAVDTERGLLVPVIRDAGDLTIGGLARRIADLAARTRDNKVTPDELGGGTFTLTNTGSRGALFDTPIINQPQVAILGTGAVVRRPMIVSHPDLGETIAIRSMVYLALSYDHRLVDGADAARFLGTVKARLEEGAFEADLGL